MATREQVETHDYFHYCHPTKPDKCQVWRKNGRMQTWKREPARFKQPVKNGLYRYGYIHDNNVENIHLPEDCPNAKN